MGKTQKQDMKTNMMICLFLFAAACLGIASARMCVNGCNHIECCTFLTKHGDYCRQASDPDTNDCWECYDAGDGCEANVGVIVGLVIGVLAGIIGCILCCCCCCSGCPLAKKRAANKAAN